MSHLTAQGVDIHRTASAVSMAASDTTYHSFQNVETHPSEPANNTKIISAPDQWSQNKFEPTVMRRQDSGYESIPTGSRSGSANDSGRRTSTASSRSSQPRPGTRPSIHRASRSSPNNRLGRPGVCPLQRTRSQQQSSAYFHFPKPEWSMSAEEITDTAAPLFPPPPQTTHYWMSDQTRRIEYAAIDAANRGVRGWILRHVVPDCFVPKSSKRVCFDDDTGSVRRYRLELDSDDVTGRVAKGRKLGWLPGR